MRVNPVMRLVLMVVVVSGCKSKDAMVLSDVVVNTPRQLDNKQQVREEIRQGLIELIAKDPMVRWKPSESADYTHVLKVHVGDVQDAADGEYRLVNVVLYGGKRSRSIRVAGQGQQPHKLKESVVSGFLDAWRVIGLHRAMELTNNPDWQGGLGHEDARVRGFTLEWIATNRVMAAVPTLIGLLGSEPSERLRLRTIGVLAELRAQAAVPALAAMTRHANASLLLQVLHALGGIGGREAEGFLVTVASGHPSDGVRRVAGEILEEMKALAEAPPTKAEGQPR